MGPPGLHVIFVLHDRLDPNTGAGGTMRGLGDHLAAAGNGIEYLSFDRLPDRLSHNAKTLIWPSYLLGKLGRAVRRETPDVVDASVGDTWLWRELDRRSRDTLLVARSHGLIHLAHQAELTEVEAGRKELSWRYPLYWGGFRLWEVARTLRGADAALFLNPLERDYAIERLGVEESRAHIVPNGIPDQFLAAPVEPAPAGEGDPIGIAQVGGWRYLKGVNDSVAALTEVLARNPNAHASFIGTGVPAEEILPNFPEALRSQVRVVRSYDRLTLPEQLHGHHIALFPSLAEGFGLGLLEAMACGLAPLATAVGGPAMLVRDGENGLSVGPGDPAGIAAGLERLLGDRDLLRRLQDAARASAEPYGFTRVADQTLAIYESALQRRSEERASR